MLTVFGLLVGVFGFFGYKSIKDEAVRRAVQSAEKAARIAADEVLKGETSGITAAGYAESQKEPPRKKKPGTTDTVSPKGPNSAAKPTSKRKATSDANLTQDEEQ